MHRSKTTRRKAAALLLFSALSMVYMQPTAAATPREELVEQALLQELHPVIYSSLQRVYHEKYPQFDSLRIAAINERTTQAPAKGETLRVDAIHGGRYFEIRVGLVKVNGEGAGYTELELSNEAADGQYHLIRHLRGSAPGTEGSGQAPRP